MLGGTAAAAASKQAVLTGYGATKKAFDAHHRADPKLKGGYLPRLKDGRDSLQVTFPGGLALWLVVNFAPAVSDEAALGAVKRVLPPDAQRIRVVRRAGCEQWFYGSNLFVREVASAIVVELRSKNGAHFARGSVVKETLSAEPVDGAIPCGHA